MNRITRQEAITLLVGLAESGLFVDGAKIQDIAECIHAETFNKDIWGKDKKETEEFCE